jgi:hypothetical protein
MASTSWFLNGNAGTNPASNFLGTTDTEPLVVKTGGAERIRVDTNGNVGIGTTNPTHPLHLPAGKTLRIEGGMSAADSANYFSFGGNGTFGIDAPGIPNGRFVVANSGNVGIGAAAPATALQIKTLTALSEGATAAGAWTNLGSNRYYDGSWQRIDTTKAGVNFHMNADDGDGQEFRFQRVEADGSNSRNIGAVGTTTSFIAGGNVGIGTGAPSTRLHVQGASDQQSTLVISRSDNNKFARLGVGGLGVTLEFDSTSFFSISNNGTVGIGGTLNGTPLMFVAGSGNVGIGTTNPASTLDVNGVVNATGLSVGALGVNSQGYIGIALDEYDVQRDGEPLSPLVVHGDIRIKGSGNLRVFGGDVLLEGADCAEDFDVAGEQPPEPGTVVVIDEGGALRESSKAYDKKVAGIVSGAGEYRHGLVLDKQSSDEGRIPIALMGKVYCKVDAQYSPIEVGDLLTTSPTPGHAMKVLDPLSAFGSVLAKALRPLRGGQDLIPVLIALQ